MPEWSCERNRNYVTWTHWLDDGRRLTFSVSDMERQRTGVHGHLQVRVDDIVLTYGRLNLDDAAARVRMVGYAVKGRVRLEEASLNGVILERNGVQYLCDEFCRQAFARYTASQGAEMVAGDTLSDLDYIVEPYALNEAGTILYAPPDTGKTYTALLLAVSVDAGIEGFWRVPRPRRVLFINLERGSHSIARRLGFVNAALGLDPERELLMLNARGRTLNDLRDVIADSVERHKVELVVLDSISRSGQGGLSEDSAVNRLMDTLNAICPAWFAVAHTPRQDHSHVFGSVHFDAAADVLIRASAHRKTSWQIGVKWQVTKGNDIPRPPAMVIGMEFDQFGLARVWPSSIREFPDLIDTERVSLAEAVSLYLTEMGSATATQIAEELGKERASIARLLNRDPRFQRIKKDAHGVHYGVTLPIEDQEETPQ